VCFRVSVGIRISACIRISVCITCARPAPTTTTIIDSFTVRPTVTDTTTPNNGVIIVLEECQKSVRRVSKEFYKSV
jgi:hypothetical protein